MIHVLLAISGVPGMGHGGQSTMGTASNGDVVLKTVCN